MYRKGIVLSLVTAFISGVSIFSNSVFVSNIDPLIFALVRNACVALLLTAILIGTKKLSELRTLSKKQWLQLFTIGAIGGGIAFALFFTGLAQVGAVNGNILNKTLFIWVALLAGSLLHERINLLQLVGYTVIFVGMFLVGGTFTFLPVAGSWLVILATMLWALEYLISKITLKKMSPQILGWGRIVFGLPFLFMATVLVGKSSFLLYPSSYVFVPIIVSSILLVCFILSWYSALKFAPATLVSSILVLAPMVTTILTFGFMGKPVSISQIGSFVLLLIGVAFISSVMIRWKRKPSESI